MIFATFIFRQMIATRWLPAGLMRQLLMPLRCFSYAMPDYAADVTLMLPCCHAATPGYAIRHAARRHGALLCCHYAPLMLICCCHAAATLRRC